MKEWKEKWVHKRKNGYENKIEEFLFDSSEQSEVK
jgi:hypothetical protein